MRRNNNFRKPVKQESKHTLNRDINHSKIRVVEGLEPGVYGLAFAIMKAEEQGLDLVLINEKADPPICKIIDYKKFLYKEREREKEQKANARANKVIVKEIRFGPVTAEHDIAFKLKNAIKFLKAGNRLKAFVFFKGRSIIHKDLGQVLLLKFSQDLEEYGKVTQLPKLEGKKMIMLIEPLKTN